MGKRKLPTSVSGPGSSAKGMSQTLTTGAMGVAQKEINSIEAIIEAHKGETEKSLEAGTHKEPSVKPTGQVTDRVDRRKGAGDNCVLNKLPDLEIILDDTSEMLSPPKSKKLCPSQTKVFQTLVGKHILIPMNWEINLIRTQNRKTNV